MCGASARFVSQDAFIDKQRAARWIDEAEAYFWEHVERPLAVHLQVLVVVLLERSNSRQYIKAQTLTAIAAKLAYMLRFNCEDDVLPTESRECRRRLMWAIFHIDKLLAGGLPEMVVCPPEHMHVQLPCNERDFELGISGKTGMLFLSANKDHQDDLTHMGLRSYYFRLSEIRYRILRYVVTT
jgi:hypothetical protein